MINSPQKNFSEYSPHIQTPSPLLFIETFIQERLLPPIYTESPTSRILTTISFEQVERSANLPTAALTKRNNPQITRFFREAITNNYQKKL